MILVAVVKYFKKRIRIYVEKGIINNLLLDTYKREIERYGAETIGYAENAFNASSELVLAYLKNISTGAFDFSELGNLIRAFISQTPA